MQVKKVFLCISPYSTAPENLALEEYFLENTHPESPILLFYQNDPSIIVGRHQNPWRECALLCSAERGIGIFRRISGGGAVFHDRGNLNFSFILDRKTYNQERVYQIIINALGGIGIVAERRNRTDIFCEGKKISGNSFFYSRDRVLHHGTLLVDTDLSSLRRLLTPDKSGFCTKAVASRPSPVINLSAVRHGISIETVRDAIANAAGNVLVYSRKPLPAPETTRPDFAKLVEKYASEGWTYGKTPPFDLSITLQPDPNPVSLTISTEKGIITGSQSLPAMIAENINSVLVGMPFDSGAISDKLLSKAGSLTEISGILYKIAGYLKNL